MKNLTFSIIALFLSARIFSQDILTLRSGLKYEIKLLEITDTDLRFKMFNNQSGPIYTISRSTFESIVYENGVKEEFALQPQESSQTVRVNGYNISASTSDGFPDQSQATTSINFSQSPPSSTQAAQKKITFGQVMGVIFTTGMMALDVAAKVEQTKYSQHHHHAHGCSR